MLSLYVKSFLLTSSAILSFAALIPPRRASERTQKLYTGQLFEYLVRSLAYTACFVIVSPSLSQSIILLSHDKISAVAPALCPANPTALHPLFDVPPRFLVGVAIVFAGALFRLWSFRALGTLFTYEVTIKNDHALITWGPYAYVRHPSYTGVLCILLGEQLMQFGAAGYVPHCGIAHTPFLVFIYIWRYGSLFTVYSLYRRCSVEDGQLVERFGATWEDYAARVRCKLLPYLL
uniref:Protein-S-isoprenylcysteine O-methyltransferase n=1 Tax=Ganoderma boninense TaxID=34458 RepID=A0A5K1JZJ5_9APHY|nr:Homeobox domain-containing protein [Ganoderma boninense]